MKSAGGELADYMSNQDQSKLDVMMDATFRLDWSSK
jgi:hypothetical protein